MLQRYEVKVLIKVLISTIVVGLFAHGSAIFNRISYHDDSFMCFSSAGSTSGRWAGDVIDFVFKHLFWNYLSTPVYFGFFALIFFSGTSYLICSLLRVKKTATIIIVSSLLVSFPTVTSCFGFMFMVHTFSFSIFLAVLTAYIICETRNFYISIFAAALGSFAVGIYQASLVVILSVFIGFILYKAFKKGNYTIKELVYDSIYYAVNSIIIFVSYFLMEKIILMVKHEKLSDHQGVSTMGQDGVVAYLKRIGLTYKKFINPAKGSADVYPLAVRFIYYVVLILIVVEAAYLLWIKYQTEWEGITRCLICVFILALLPIAFDFIYVMVDVDRTHVYSMMLYSLVFPFVLCAIFTAKTKDICESKAFFNIIDVLATIVLLFVIVSNIRFSNLCYTKGLMQQEQAKSYFTTLICNIESAEGYSADMPVFYINDLNKRSVSNETIETYEKIELPPYSETVINNYAWKEFMEVWCGYRPDEINPGMDAPEIKNMPRYPDSGSVKVVNGVVVVNF